MLTSFLNKHLRYVRVVKKNHVTLLVGVSRFFSYSLKNYLTDFVLQNTKEESYYRKVLLNGFQMNGRTKGFRSQNKV